MVGKRPGRVVRASNTTAVYFNMPFAIVLSCMLLVPS